MRDAAFAVLTADQLREIVREAYAEGAREVRQGARAEESQLLTPMEVRALLKVQKNKVFDALKTGALPSIRRPTRGGKLGHFVKKSDALAWNPRSADRRNS